MSLGTWSRVPTFWPQPCGMRGSASATVDGGGHGVADSHMRKYLIAGILREQEGERGGAGARQAQADERRDDLLVVDLGMSRVPVLHLESLRQVADDPRVEVSLAGRVEARFVAERAHQDLQSFAERVVPEVVQTGLRDRLDHELVVRRHVPSPRSYLAAVRCHHYERHVKHGRVEHGARRRYDSPVRRQQAAETRDRIVTAGSELVHEFASWNWEALTFRAVAERAGVGERTVYRHFPTERQLHDAVMARLETEAGVNYEDLELANLPEITARVFSSPRIVRGGVASGEPDDPTFVEVDQRRRDALIRAVTAATPEWSDTERRTIAALLDVVWNMPGYERLVGAWDFTGDDATHAITWLMSLLTDTIDAGDPPPTPRSRQRSRSRTIAR